MQNYTKGDILLTLRMLQEQKIGRKNLSRSLGLGEATVRTLFHKLESENLVQSTAQGQKITEKGVQYLVNAPCFTLPRLIRGGEFTLSQYNMASLVRNYSQKVKDGMQFRDAAIVAGAFGATTLIFHHRKLTFPDNTELTTETVQYLIREFDPQENDILIIATAETEQKALRGLSGCLSLLLENDDRML